MALCESCGAELPDESGPLCAECQSEREDRDSQDTVDVPMPSEPSDSTADEPPTSSKTVQDDDAGTVVFDDTGSHTEAGTAAGLEERGGAPTLHGAPPGELTVDLDGGQHTNPGDDNLTRHESMPPGPFADSDHTNTVDLDRKIERMWDGAESSDTTPSATLHVEVSHLGNESLLSVSSRPVAYPETSGNTKADYRVEKFIAKGGMGRVYLAQQTSLGRTVALKTLAEDLAQKERYRRKFFAEASITGVLDHPNIVPIHDLGVRGDGVPFYSMKFVTGEPWSDSIKSRTKSENVEVLMSVADAMAFAHSRRILHRDLKPENVMLGEYGEVLVVDWGLAIHLDRDKEFSLGGTPLYMAPEMANHDVPLIGERSDVYLLGAMLFEILEGKAPHSASAKSATKRLLVAARNEIIEHKSADELIDVALKAMETNPSDRYDSVRSFQDAIRVCQRHADSRERSERAREELAGAREAGENERYARALFAYQDAIDLWPENGAAAEGLQETRLAYAEHALGQEDYALGLSLLDPENQQHSELRQKLLDAQHQEKLRGRRLRLARIAAGVATIATVGSLTAFAFFANDAANKQRVLTAEAEASAEEATKQRDAADEQRVIAETQRGIAVSNEQKAIKAQEETAEALKQEAKAKAEAVAEGERARQAELLAVAEQRRAEASEANAKHRAFVAELALTAADLAVADTDNAGERLASIEADYPELLDWEADRLRFLLHRDFARQDAGGLVSSVTSTNEHGQMVAIVGASGATRLVVLRLGDGGKLSVDGQLETRVTEPRVLALGPGGRTAVAGRGADGEPLLELGSVNDSATRLVRVPESATEVTALAFSPSGDELAAARHAPLSVRVEVIDADAPPAALDPALDSSEEYLLAGAGEFVDLCWSADGSRLAAAERSATGGQSNATVWRRPGPGRPFSDKTKLPASALCVGFAPGDERLLAVGVAGGELILWRVPESDGDGALAVERFERHTDDLRTVRFSPDGRSLVTASESGVAYVWRRGRGPLEWAVDNRPPLRHLSALRGADWSADGGTLVTTDADGLSRAWPLDGFYNVRRAATSGGAAVTAIATSQDERLMVVGDANGHTRVFKPSAPESPIADFYIGHPGPIARSWLVHSGGDESTVTLGFHNGEATLCRWGDESRTTLPGVNEKDLIDLSPDGQTMVVASLQQVRLIRVTDGQELATSTLAASSVAFLPSGSLAIGDARGRVTILERNGDQFVRGAAETIASRQDVRLLASPRSNDSSEVLYAATDSQTPGVYRLVVAADGAMTASRLPTPPATVRALHGLPDGGVAVECGDRGELFVPSSDRAAWTPAGRDVLGAGSASQPTARRPISLSYPAGADGRTVAVLSDDGLLRTWSTESPNRPASIHRAIPEGARIVSAARLGTGPAACVVAVVDGATVAFSPDAPGRPWRELPGVRALGLSASSTCAVGQAVTVVWDPAQGRRFTWPHGLTAAAPMPSVVPGVTGSAVPLPVAIDHSGRTAVVAETENGRALLLWHNDAVPPLRVELDHTNITTLRFSESGDRLLAGTMGGRIIVYDVSASTTVGADEQPRVVRRLDELTTFAEHRRPVTQLRFSPTGEVLLSGDRQGQAIWWPTAKAE